MTDEAIHQTVARLVDAWNRHDIQAFVSLFTEDADYVSSVGQWLKGSDAIEFHFSDSEAMNGVMGSVIINETWIRYLKPDIALVHNKWALVTDTVPKAQGSVLREGFITQVLICEDKGWRIAALHNTDYVT